MSDKLQWYAYKLDNGKIFIKRYYDYGDIAEAKESTFVETVIGPYEAYSKDEAAKIARDIMFFQ